MFCREEGLPLTSAPSGCSKETLLENIHKKVPFHEGRWQCLFRPDRARYVLGPYAKLEITIVQARHLLPSNCGVINRLAGTFPHPFVKVFLDETPAYETDHVANTRDPVWSYQEIVDITTPTSVLRLEVFDTDSAATREAENLAILSGVAASQKPRHDSLGFVEFCPGDMPFDTEVAGWMELRFPDNLQGSGWQRYREHAEMREDAAHVLEGFDDDMRKASVKIKSSRSARLLRRLGSRSSTHRDASLRYNAGEVLVRMHLRLASSRIDSVFALALSAPVTTYTSFIQQENLPKMDVQELFDDAMDIKLMIVDDFVLCIASYVWYILLWRSVLLSAIVTLAVVASFVKTDLMYIALQGLTALLLVLNGIPSARAAMTTGGWNAPLTEAGFQTVARWNCSKHMKVFLMRVMISRGYLVRDELGLAKFAAQAAWRGKWPPLETVVEVLVTLGLVEWKEEEKDKVKAGSLVRIDERRRAVVTEVGADSRIGVMYDEPPSPFRDNFDEARLFPRVILPKIPRMFVATSLQNMIRAAGLRTDKVKFQIVPVVELVRDVMTWRRPALTFCLFMYFAGRTVLATLVFLFDWPVLGKIVYLIRSVKVVVLFSVCIFILICLAQPLQWVFSLLRICWRLMRRQHQSPASWAFLRPQAENHQAAAVHEHVQVKETDPEKQHLEAGADAQLLAHDPVRGSQEEEEEDSFGKHHHHKAPCFGLGVFACSRNVHRRA